MKTMNFGGEYHLHEIENDNLVVKTTDFGAAMVSIIDKKTGIDILCGFDDVSGYIKQDAHIGGFIGRTANRTRGSQFILNGITYEIDRNDGNNNLHGGHEGFDRVKYETTLKENEICYQRTSKDGEMGYPGNLHVSVSYCLQENRIVMTVKGSSDKDTVFAWTNHNYFNLDGSTNVENHEVTIYADAYANNGSDGCSDGQLVPVEGTVFDFRKPTKLSKNINSKEKQIASAKGFDHYFSIAGNGKRKFAECCGKKLKLTICSDMPGMHMYTGNFIDVIGKKGVIYTSHSTVCFEPEYYPNAINYEGYEKPILKVGEFSSHSIEWVIEHS